MRQIPQIIHQIWSGIEEPLPEHYRILGESWKKDYPAWKYELWDNAKIASFIDENYPQYKDAYNEFLYNVQRWDAIRYLILQKTGGIYADFDYESLKPIDDLIEGKTCCFAGEEEFIQNGNISYYFNNALMASVPNHPFMQKIINRVFSNYEKKYNNLPKFDCVLQTTGPRMLNKLYWELPEEEKRTIFLMATKDVSPLTFKQAFLLRKGQNVEEIMESTKNAYAIHYFLGGWIK